MEQIKVLLVDDDIDIITMMKIRLSMEAPNFSISLVEGGLEGLEYLKSNEVDCILSDYQMPGMDGMELLLAIRGRGDNIPFIFVTGQGNEEVARDAFKNGADDYFTKDIGFAHFARIINSVEQAVTKRSAERSKLETEHALLQEKNKLESILASIGDGISIQDKEYKVLYQNQAHISLVGHHVGEYCYAAYEKREDVCEACPVAETFGDGEAHSAQRTTVTDKGTIYVDIKSSPLKDVNGNIVAGIEVARDVTGKKLADEALRESEARYHNFVANSSEAIWRCEGDEPTPVSLEEEEQIESIYRNSYLAECNEAAARMVGYEKSIDAIGARLTEIQPRENPDNVEFLRAFIRSGYRLVNYETVLMDAQGNTHYVMNNMVGEVINGGLVRAWGVSHDITRQKQIEKAILRSNEMLKNILDSVNFGMMVISRDCIVRIVNRTALRMMGYASESEIVGKTCHKVICPAETGRCPILDMGMHLDLSERVLLDRLGNKIPILKSVSPIMLENEEVLLETFVDISGRKKEG